MTIYHIALPEEWEQAQKLKVWVHSTRGVSINEQGFLYACADMDQVKRVSDFIYGDRPDILVLEIDPRKLESAGFTVRWEPADPSNPSSELFPHVYGGHLPLYLFKVLHRK
ncbi:DUF952 domain-containing protein [Rothia nasimurium]|uniref:DUF952 domain-containing protein n=1 Tax=Rothia nasimurium TaxID=85336 RepID=UPI003C6E97EA